MTPEMREIAELRIKSSGISIEIHSSSRRASSRSPKPITFILRASPSSLLLYTHFAGTRGISARCHRFHVDVALLVFVQDQTEGTQQLHHIVVGFGTATGSRPAHKVLVVGQRQRCAAAAAGCCCCHSAAGDCRCLKGRSQAQKSQDGRGEN